MSQYLKLKIWPLIDMRKICCIKLHKMVRGYNISKCTGCLWTRTFRNSQYQFVGGFTDQSKFDQSSLLLSGDGQVYDLVYKRSVGRDHIFFHIFFGHSQLAMDQ